MEAAIRAASVETLRSWSERSTSAAFSASRPPRGGRASPSRIQSRAAQRRQRVDQRRNQPAAGDRHGGLAGVVAKRVQRTRRRHPDTEPVQWKGGRRQRILHPGAVLDGRWVGLPGPRLGKLSDPEELRHLLETARDGQPEYVLSPIEDGAVLDGRQGGFDGQFGAGGPVAAAMAPQAVQVRQREAAAAVRPTLATQLAAAHVGVERGRLDAEPGRRLLRGEQSANHGWQSSHIDY